MGRPPFVPSYTGLLFACGLLAALAVGLETVFISGLEAQGDDAWIVWLLRIDQILALILAPAALLTAMARLRGWRFAAGATRAVSLFLALIIPIGTAVFIYWWTRVRTLESG